MKKAQPIVLNPDIVRQLADSSRNLMGLTAAILANETWARGASNLTAKAEYAAAAELLRREGEVTP